MVAVVKTVDSGYISLTVGGWGGWGAMSVGMVEGGETGDSGYICLKGEGGGGYVSGHGRGRGDW